MQDVLAETAGLSSTWSHPSGGLNRFVLYAHRLLMIVPHGVARAIPKLLSSSNPVAGGGWGMGHQGEGQGGEEKRRKKEKERKNKKKPSGLVTSVWKTKPQVKF